METEVTIQVGGMSYGVAPGFFPPVGTLVHVHKHLNDGGSYVTVEVLEHEWRLEEARMREDGEEGLPVFTVHLKTRIVK